MLGLTTKEERQELDSLLVTYKLKGLEREKIIARLQEKDRFDGKKAYQEFKTLKPAGKETTVDSVDVNRSLCCRVRYCGRVVRWKVGIEEREGIDRG